MDGTGERRLVARKRDAKEKARMQGD